VKQLQKAKIKEKVGKVRKTVSLLYPLSLGQPIMVHPYILEEGEAFGTFKNIQYN
jgi:hypothetical protein